MTRSSYRFIERIIAWARANRMPADASPGALVAEYRRANRTTRERRGETRHRRRLT